MNSKNLLFASGSSLAVALGLGAGAAVVPDSTNIVPFLAFVSIIVAIITGLLGLAEMSVEDEWGPQ